MRFVVHMNYYCHFSYEVFTLLLLRCFLVLLLKKYCSEIQNRVYYTLFLRGVQLQAIPRRKVGNGGIEKVTNAWTLVGIIVKKIFTKFRGQRNLFLSNRHNLFWVTGSCFLVSEVWFFMQLLPFLCAGCPLFFGRSRAVGVLC